MAIDGTDTLLSGSVTGMYHTNRALIELHAWVKEIKYIARITLKDEPQLLEALGIVVPSSR